jgi:hypothetical protein
MNYYDQEQHDDFVITVDKISEPDEQGYGVGVIGPRECKRTAEQIKAEGQHFKMYDDDGEHYYSGYCVEESLSPLDCYGTPNAGCTHIKYRQKDGSYKIL